MLVILAPDGQLSHTNADEHLLQHVAEALGYDAFADVPSVDLLPTPIVDVPHFVTTTYADNNLHRTTVTYIRGIDGSATTVAHGEMLHALADDSNFTLLHVNGENGAHYFTT